MDAIRLLQWSGIVAALYALLSFLAHRQLYYPIRYPEGFYDDLGEAQDVWLRAADGVRLHALYYATSAPWVTLHIHGNAGNVSYRGEHARRILAAGSAVLLLEYRGYGRSEGVASKQGLYTDARAGYDYLRSLGFSPERIVIQGESLGSTVAVDLAAEKPCAGLVLEGAFPSARAVAGRALPWLGPLLIWGFDAKSKIGRVRAPVLFIHGDRDTIIAPDLGRELYEAANEPKAFWSVPNADHNELVDVAGDRYTERLRDFYATLSQAARK